MVHRTNITEDQVFVLQLLRDQIGQRVYPVHRLDRGTSGVLIFGKTKEAASVIAEQFRNQKIEKEYLAVVRGFVESEGVIDYAINVNPGKPLQDAITHYQRISQVELPIPIGRYATARYAFVQIQPKTGRQHQIRRHFAHLRHPIIGDKRYGDVKHNKYFKQEFGLNRFLLHAWQMSLKHPFDKSELIQENSTLIALSLLCFKSNNTFKLIDSQYGIHTN